MATAVDDQASAIEQLRADAEGSYREAVRTVGVQTADGTLLRGEVLSRWHDFVGTGEFFRAVEQKIGDNLTVRGTLDQGYADHFRPGVSARYSIRW